MSQTTRQHKADSPEKVRCAVVTISDTRTVETDLGGAVLVELLSAAGHDVVDRRIIPDEPEPMRRLVLELAGRDDVDAILMTGGTGISSRDGTFETVVELLTRPLPGYGELFRMLSYEQIGPAAMLSRAVGGLVERTALFAMPGSPNAVRLAMEKIILPELGHVVGQARQ